MEFPNKKYQIIYADPPWTYRDKANSGKRESGYKYNLMGNIPRMSYLQEIIIRAGCLGG